MPRAPPLPLELPAIRDKDSDFFDLDRFRLCERLPIKPARDRDRCAVTWGRVRPEIRPDWVDSFVRERNVRDQFCRAPQLSLRWIGALAHFFERIGIVWG